MSTDFIVIIPARYASTRLPGKALLDINGKSLVQRVHERAAGSRASARASGFTTAAGSSTARFSTVPTIGANPPC